MKPVSFAAMVGFLVSAAPAGAQPPSPPPQSASASPSLTPQQLYEHVRRGVVVVLRGDAPAAVGTVLSGDGRILTALSGLNGAAGADVRYADGTTVHTKLGHSDRSLDLALLVPEGNRWTDGLTASELDPAGLDVRAMLPVRAAVGTASGTQTLGPTFAALKGRTEAHTRSGEPLVPMLNVDVQTPLAGAPLLDANGAVVAVLVRECRGAAPEGHADGKGACQPAFMGAPVGAIRSFLSEALGPSSASPHASPARPGAVGAVGPAGGPAPLPTLPSSGEVPGAPARPAPWLGVRVEPSRDASVRGVRVVAIAPSSPAAEAGLHAGAAMRRDGNGDGESDTIVAVDGVPISTPEALASAIARHAPGDAVKLLVFGGGEFRQLAVTLRPAPAETN